MIVRVASASLAACAARLRFWPHMMKPKNQMPEAAMVGPSLIT